MGGEYGCWGEALGQKERDMMTDLMRRVRSMTEEEGHKRGRPLLIAVRVPDSVGYCHGLGFDLLKWPKEDLVDIMVVGGYFWLQPWERSVAIGRKYDVPVYPSLDGSRMGHYQWVSGREESRRVRRSDEAYHAHALNAWNAGADGIYLFNFNHNHPPSHRLWTDLGNPQTLMMLDKIYHVSVMGHGHDALEYYLPTGLAECFLQLPVLSPDHPRELLAGEPVATSMTVGDDVLWAKAQSFEPQLALNVQVENLPHGGSLSVKLNGQILNESKLTW